MFELVISTYRRKTKNITLNLFKTKMNHFLFLAIWIERTVLGLLAKVLSQSA